MNKKHLPALLTIVIVSIALHSSTVFASEVKGQLNSSGTSNNNNESNEVPSNTYSFSNAYGAKDTQFVDTQSVAKSDTVVPSQAKETSGMSMKNEYAQNSSANQNDVASPAITDPATAVAPNNEPIVPQVTENPGQLASVMAAIGAGDLAVWFWLTAILLLVVLVGMYAYYRYNEPVTRSSYDGYSRFD